MSMVMKSGWEPERSLLHDSHSPQAAPGGSAAPGSASPAAPATPPGRPWQLSAAIRARAVVALPTPSGPSNK